MTQTGRAQAFIRENLPLEPVPGVPEIRLHLARPGSGLLRLAELDPEGFGSPYWAYPWAGGLALARHVLDRPETVAGRRVLDFGAGSGLVAVAAGKAGAQVVIAAETDRYGAAAIPLNAQANDVAVTVVAEDLMQGPPPAVDIVLAGDVFYAAGLARRATAFLDRCVAAGIEVLVGDPRRAFLPLPRLRLLAEYEVADFGGTATPGAVFAFEAAGA